jgi:integrase
MAWIEERRRAQQDGSLGPVHLRVHYLDPLGRKRNRSFTDPKSARQFARQVEVDLRRGDWQELTRRTKTFDQVADLWWETTEDLRPNTRRGYWRLLEGHVRPWFGTARVASITTMDVDAFIAAKRRADYSGKYVRAMVSVLSLVMDYACRSRPPLRKDNPAQGKKIRGASRRVRQSDVLTMAEAVRLVEQVTPWYRAATWVLVYTGMRPAEMCGLLVGDVDFGRGLVHVDRTYSPIPAYADRPRRHQEGPVKTEGGERSIPIPGWLVTDLAAMLSERADRTGRRAEPGDRLFVNEAGRPVNRDTFRCKVMRPALRRAGLPETLRTYDLRHSHASMLIEEGGVAGGGGGAAGERQGGDSADLQPHVRRGSGDPHRQAGGAPPGSPGRRGDHRDPLHWAQAGQADGHLLSTGTPWAPDGHPNGAQRWVPMDNHVQAEMASDLGR